MGRAATLDNPPPTWRCTASPRQDIWAGAEEDHEKRVVRLESAGAGSTKRLCA
jgi:hypothetical protein